VQLRDTPTSDAERRLLGEINALADRLRGLRQSDAVRHDAQIKAMAAQLRSKWEDLRVMRAPPPPGDFASRGRGGLYG
jgi:hypothetical protein